MGVEQGNEEGGLIDDALIYSRVHLPCSLPVYFGRGRTRGRNTREGLLGVRSGKMELSKGDVTESRSHRESTVTSSLAAP